MLKVISFLIILYSHGRLVYIFAIYAQDGLNLFSPCKHDYVLPTYHAYYRCHLLDFREFVIWCGIIFLPIGSFLMVLNL